MSARVLAEFVERNRDAIVSRFVSEVQGKGLVPAGTSRPLLVDHIPKFLDEMVVELTRVTSVRASDDALGTSPTARQHGEQRWGLGYDLAGLIREYGVLRHCILQAAKESELQLSIDELDVLAKCLSVGVAEAAARYEVYRDEQLRAQELQLQFLVEAGELLSSSLDYRSTLSGLTGLLVPRLADWCAVHLEGAGVDQMPLAHVDPTKLELLRDLYRRYPVASDSADGYPHAVHMGEPRLVVEVDQARVERMAKSAEHLALLRAIGTCSWMIVPLRVQGSTFGAITLAYTESGRRYGEQDLRLVGEITRRAATAIDHAKLYERSQAERSRLEAAARAQDEFVAMVSHELRTPLNAILGWLHVIQSSTLDEAKRAHALDVIERNAHAQSHILADLLDMSRAITGQVRIHPAQLDLSNVVDMAVEGIRPAAESKQIRIELELERNDAVMRGDSERLQQVVWNLVANAVKYTPKNGVVRVRLRRRESNLELSVEDTGSGIEASFLPHVFDRFRQSNSSTTRAHGGLGVGLSIAKHIVELHGGSIEAHSPGVDRGSTFAVRLPISPLVSSTLGVRREPAAKEPFARQTLAGGLEGVRVLVVDDDPDAGELVAYVLETSGCEVLVATSAADALTALETHTPHVIISDIGMPDEDGYALIRRIRTHPSEDKKNIPAIALTAFAGTEGRTRSLLAGFNVHMTKPVELAALVKAIRDVAGARDPNPPAP